MKLFQKSLFWVVLISVVLAGVMNIVAWDINFFPSDIRDYYMRAVIDLPQLDYISDIHKSLDTDKVKFLHGKEGMILLVSILKQWLGDTGTLRPFLLTTIWSHCLAAILIFLLARRYWGAKIAWICYLVFITSVWPYIYMLFIKHQILGLAFFLLALFTLHQVERKRIGWMFAVFSGASLCFGFYSSTISALYVPYYLAGFWYQGRNSQHRLRTYTHDAGLCLAGFVLVFVYFNYPNIVYNVKAYLEYVSISSTFNHFYYQQPYLTQWISGDIPSTRGGWLWVGRYFLTITPVLFPVVLGCIAYLLRRCPIKAAGIILLGISSPLLAELRGVAQYGANYFNALVGMLLILGYSLSRVQKKGRIYFLIGIFVFGAHVFSNGILFFGDVFPSRMATTSIARKIEDLGVRKVYTYATHPNRRFIIDCLNPSVRQKIQFIPIDNIYQPKDGYILVPPMTTESVYNGQTAFTDYSKDIYMNELITSGKIKDYTVATFKTLASSRIWPLEEEVLTYKHLILKLFSPRRLERGKAWILDAKKLYADRANNLPREEFRQQILNGARNIGTKDRLYMYNGIVVSTATTAITPTHPLRVQKIGNPTDALVSYVYRKDDNDANLWVPYPSLEEFASNPVEAHEITSDIKGRKVNFRFKKPLKLEPGTYLFLVFRTGKSSDEHFYRAYAANQKYINEYIQAARIPGINIFK